jgi:hypothetical protein
MNLVLRAVNATDTAPALHDGPEREIIGTEAAFAGDVARRTP